MNFIKTPTKGMRDILPKSMELREYVLSLMKETYQLFGFEMMQTPVVEHIENLTNKQGGDNEKLIFKIMKRGEKLKLDSVDDFDSLVDCGLRYDLTVPLSRFYANNLASLSQPFRSFQVGNVYRAERSQRGRFREFMQCDLDILGEKTNIAEIELIIAVTTFLKKLNFTGFTIKINDRRILTKMIEHVFLSTDKLEQILISLDKIDKIGIDGVKEDLKLLDLKEEDIDKYLGFFQNDSISLEEFCSLGEISADVIFNLQTIINSVRHVVDASIKFDPTLVRGMGYYTGTIFEICVEDLGSSIGGGGRYDKMIEKYVNVSVPACGFSIGFERLLLLLEERGFSVPTSKEKLAYLFSDDVNMLEMFEKANEKRLNGAVVKIVPRSKNFKFQKEMLEKDGYTIVQW